MRMLSIGEGEVWHDASQRRLLLGLAALAFVPFIGLLLPATGLISNAVYHAMLAIPVLTVVAAAVGYTYRRYPQLFRRIVVGLGAGLLAVAAYDALYVLGMALGWVHQGHPTWSGLGGFGGGLWGLVKAYFYQGVLTGALWGMAYGLFLGKVRWTVGVLFGVALWSAAVTFALFVPFGGPFVPGMSAGAALALLAAYVVYGTVLGLVSERWQRDLRSNGKIIFLRDYQAKVSGRKG